MYYLHSSNTNHTSIPKAWIQMETVPLQYHSSSSIPKPILLSSKSRAWMKVFESHPDLKDLHILTVYWSHIPQLLWRLLSEQMNLGGKEPPPVRSSSISPVPRGPSVLDVQPCWSFSLLDSSLSRLPVAKVRVCREETSQPTSFVKPSQDQRSLVIFFLPCLSLQSKLSPFV